jgi:hypothetical protein
MNLIRVDLSMLLSLPACLRDVCPLITSSAALSISARGVWPQEVFLWYCLGMISVFYNVYDIKNKTYVM